MIVIGCVFKVFVKGFVFVENNVWFDSVVMLWDYVEISVDIDEKVWDLW